MSRNRLWLLALGSSLAGLACATKFSAGTIAVGFVCGAVLTAKTVRLAALRTVVSGAVWSGLALLLPSCWRHWRCWEAERVQAHALRRRSVAGREARLFAHQRRRRIVR